MGLQRSDSPPSERSEFKIIPSLLPAPIPAEYESPMAASLVIFERSSGSKKSSLSSRGSKKSICIVELAATSNAKEFGSEKTVAKNWGRSMHGYCHSLYIAAKQPVESQLVKSSLVKEMIS